MTPIHVGKRLGHANATEVLRRYAHAWEQQESKWGDDFDALRAEAQKPAAPAAMPSNVVSLASRRN
jgi:hypothetical protein